MKAPVRTAIVGLGGFAAAHHRTIAQLEERGQVRLVCTCDPAPAAFAVEQQEWRLAARRVQVFADYRAMLAACGERLDLVVVPTPIQLHAEMHAAGMLTTQDNFLVRGIWPGATGWTRNPGEVVTAADLPRFHDTVRAMAGPERGARPQPKE